jgi:hypothetical protein
MNETYLAQLACMADYGNLTTDIWSMLSLADDRLSTLSMYVNIYDSYSNVGVRLSAIAFQSIQPILSNVLANY